jgi:phenylalanyl-tRNA synthetase beta chain
MKFPYSMLQDFVETRLTAEQVGDLLTMAGFELEGIEEVEGEPVFDIKVVSNRGDGLSVFGLSREILAKDPEAKPTELYRQSASQFEGNDPTEGTGGPAAHVEIQTSDCHRFSCRVFTDVHNGQSPEWMQKRLRQAGMRPISLLVDLTNYVMLEQGQPMHAFDYDTLKGGKIIVRKAKPAEKLTTLNGDEHELRTDQMMICDADRAVAVAGVMGGLETEVGDTTRTILLESANFLNTSIRRTRKQLGLTTEASYRFERSVDPERTVAAIRRFSQLLTGVVHGGQPSPTIVDHYPTKPRANGIKLRLSRATKLLGMTITGDEAQRYLHGLGFTVRETAPQDGAPAYEIAAPSWRPDIVREDDLVEELGRIHGYEKIPEKLPHGESLVGGAKGYLKWKDQLREAIIRTGFNQVISHSLRSTHPLDDPTVKRIGPRGITDPEMMWLRNSVLPSLADAAKVNGVKDVQLFEIGQVFGKEGENPLEQTHLGFLSEGSLSQSDWLNKQPEQTGFYHLKAIIEASVGALVQGLETRSTETNDPRFHPTRQAALFCRGERVGILGQIHPDVAEEADLSPETVLAELYLEELYLDGKHSTDYKALSRNPAVRRDLAILIDKAVPFAEIESRLKEAAGTVLERHWLFDIYAGQGIPEGKHSLAIAMQLRKMGENFTDEEANQVREKVVEALAALGATQR